MNSILVDTDIISFLFKRAPLAGKLDTILAEYQYRFVSFQTIAELEKWALLKSWGRRSKADLNYFLESYTILHCDDSTCLQWAKVMADCQRTGRRIHPEDAWIAATAFDVELPLLTNNEKDFETVAGLELLTPKGN